MNIIFTDKLSANTWHNHCRHPAHREAFLDFLTPFLCGAWSRQEHDDFVVETLTRGDETVVRPDWSKQSGYIARLRIAVGYTSTYYDTDAMLHGRPSGPYALEFNWVVEQAEVDQFGRPKDEDKWGRVIFGGWINHSDHEKPSWSSHT